MTQRFRTSTRSWVVSTLSFWPPPPGSNVAIESVGRSVDMAQGDWWFDLKTHQVVPDNNDTKVTDRLGPYKTREEAQRALERVEERNEEYDNDPRWNDDR